MSLAFLHAHDCSEAQSDAVWGVSWTAQDTVISTCADGSVRQWTSATGQPHPPNGSPPPPHALAQVSLSTSKDGKYALSNSIEGMTCLWDLDSTGERGNIELKAKFESYSRSAEGDDREPSWSVSLDPNTKMYASSGASGNVTIHSAEAENFGQRLSTLQSGRNKFGMFCSYSPDGKRIAMSNETGQIFLFDVEASSLVQTFNSHAMPVRSLAWSYEGDLLFSASDDKRVGLHDVRVSSTGGGGGSVATFTGHSSWVLSVDAAVDGRLAVSGSSDKTIRVWDVAARAAVSTIQESSEIWSVSWRPKPSPHGTNGAFVTGSEDGTVRWWRSAGAGG